MRAYRTVISMVWTLPLVLAAICTALNFFISAKHAIYLGTLYVLILIFIMCGCNIAIRRQFPDREVSPHNSKKKASQNKRLTKTLLFVSVLALLPFLPLIIMHFIFFAYQGQIPWTFCDNFSLFQLFYQSSCVCIKNS